MPVPSRYSSSSRPRPIPRWRVELAANYAEVEHARENFPLTYLPEEAEDLFKEALNCYSAGCFKAFGAMSRRTAQSLFRELGERGKLELFDTLQQIRSLAELDDETFATLRAVLFGSDSDPWPHHPDMNSETAGVLLEVMPICCIRPSCARRGCYRQ